MSRRAAAALVAAAAALALAGAIWLVRSRPAAPAVAPGIPAVVAAGPQSPAETWHATLWLPTNAGLLASREVEVTSAPEIRPRLAALLATLLAAPDEGETTAVFPAGVGVAALVLAADGTLYVDLRGADGGPPPGAGSTLEMQRIYAIVHTVMRNEPRVGRVVLLWNGVQRESLSGHVDTRRPLALRAELEAK